MEVFRVQGKAKEHFAADRVQPPGKQLGNTNSTLGGDHLISTFWGVRR